MILDIFGFSKSLQYLVFFCINGYIFFKVYGNCDYICRGQFCEKYNMLVVIYYYFDYFIF